MPDPKPENIIKNKALELGFDLCGIVPVRILREHGERLNSWLAKGMNAGMSYMERNREKRLDPGLLVKDARSVIVTATNYYQTYNPAKYQPVFARYALGRDYHRVIKNKLYELLGIIKEMHPGAGGRVFVDTAPVLERAWAVEAGLGWIGKNSMFINKKLGSFTFLGVIVVDVELDYDSPFEKDYCGSCRKCIHACPANAISEDRTIDSNKCLSYLTIEHRDELPDDFHEIAANKVFGCDICQEVCPWNKNVPEKKIKEFEPLPEIINYTTEQWKNISRDEFNSIFKDSPVQRTGYDHFLQVVSEILQ